MLGLFINYIVSKVDVSANDACLFISVVKFHFLFTVKIITEFSRVKFLARIIVLIYRQILISITDRIYGNQD